MANYNDILFFDTETTGLPAKGADWAADYMAFPRICQLSWIYNGREENHIIYPDGWEIPAELSELHGITTQRAYVEGEPFGQVVLKFMEDCAEARLICGHNIYFDVSMIKSELMRYGLYEELGAEDALHKGKRIDTMRASMKWVDARRQNGALKFPNLTELYSRCFPGESFPAHDAICDVRAVVRCLPLLVDMGLVALEVKEYPEENGVKCSDCAKNVRNAPVSRDNVPDDKLHGSEKKEPQIENLAKITPTAAAFASLLAEDNF